VLPTIVNLDAVLRIESYDQKVGIPMQYHNKYLDDELIVPHQTETFKWYMNDNPVPKPPTKGKPNFKNVHKFRTLKFMTRVAETDVLDDKQKMKYLKFVDYS
jgi:hypothetical protein